MNFTITADSLTDSLVPYLAAGQNGDTPLADATSPLARAIWRQLLAVFERYPQAETVFRALIAQPHSSDAQNVFREELRELLEHDAGLLAQIEAALAAIDAPLRPIIEYESEDTTAYPRPMPSRRRCEG